MNVTATTDPAACGAAEVVLVQCKAASTTTAVRSALDAGVFRLEREEIVSEFLRYYEPVGPGLLCFSVLWTGDPTGGALDLRPSGEHTHCYHPTDPGMGGHYHFDVTPDAVHCRGWFAPAETVYRVGNIYARLRNASRP